MRRATLKLKSSLLAVTEQLKRQFPEQKTKELGRNDHRISVRKSCSRPKADMKGEDFDSSNPCRNRRVTGIHVSLLSTEKHEIPVCALESALFV
jgi:hypothetical protein